MAQAAPDGYTLLVASNSSLGINPVLFKNLQYDVARDFAPVTRGVIVPMVIVGHPDANVKTMADEIAKAMKSPALAAKLEQQALLPVFDTPEQFAASLKEEQQNWGAFIRQHNIQPD